jgi:inosine-uridine nucleoside N-ribohydrolase
MRSTGSRILYLGALGLLLFAPAGPVKSQARERPMKIIFDTDIGTDIDDAWALAFVVAHAGFEALGVTITNANTPARARIACKLLHLTGRGDVPVAVGRSTSQAYEYQYSWAEDFEAKRPIDTPAADFIVETVRRHPGEVTLVAVGPLENLADALRKEPDLGRYVKRVVLMSGCVYGMAGGQSVVPEWNVVSSTKDAQVVYGAGLPLTIVPLDSTTHVQLRDDERERMRKDPSVLATSLEALYRLWLSDRDARMTLHDQMAVAEAASPGTFFGRTPKLNLRVDDEGYTRVDRAGKPVAVCLEPRRDEFMRYYIGQLLAWRPASP